MQRRAFLRLATGTALGSLGLLGAGCADTESPREPAASAAAGSRTLPHIGVQLYTLRRLMQQDFDGVLRQVAEIGYDQVEFAGYYDRTPDAVKALLDEVGLTAPAVHVGLPALRQNLAGVLDAAEVIGHRYVVCPWLAEEDRTPEGYRTLAADLNRFGEACAARGLRMAYHNHDFEFEPIDGKPAFDRLLEQTDPELVDIELDLFWTVKAGQDPLVYFERYPGRFTLCHVKDMAGINGEQRMVAVGQGEIDFARIFAASEQAGLAYYFVEHDNPDDPLESIRTSYQYLSQLTF